MSSFKEQRKIIIFQYFLNHLKNSIIARLLNFQSILWFQIIKKKNEISFKLGYQALNF